MSTGKIDKVYDEMIKMEERFTKLEREQQKHFEEHIEKAAAAIISEIKKKLEECDCNKEIINLIHNMKKEKGKEKSFEENKVDKPKQKISLGWHPENLRIEDTPFYK